MSDRNVGTDVTTGSLGAGYARRGRKPAPPATLAPMGILDLPVPSTPRLSGTYALRGAVDVRDFGMVADGATNSSTAFQAAINAAAALVSAQGTPGFAHLYVPPGYYRVFGITIPGNVHIRCDGTRFTPPNGSSGYMFDFTGGFSTLEGATLAGGTIAGCTAIHTSVGARWNFIDQCRFDNWDGRAIYDQGLATWMTRLLATNCLLSADTLTTYTGVVEMAGTDSFLSQSELTASRYPARGMSASGKACALAITGANHMVENVVAETSDHGVYLGAGATQLNLEGVRGELCYGHGWIIDGGSGRISNPMALRNSKSANLAGNGFNVTGSNGPRYIIVNAWSESDAAPTRQNWGVFDGTTSRSTFNRWINPIDVGSNGAFFATNSTSTSWSFPDNPPAPMATNSTTPDVRGTLNFTISNSSAVTVTNFNGGVNGQRLLILGDGNTSVANNATIVTTSGATTLLAASTWYRFIRHEGVWRQLP